MIDDFRLRVFYVAALEKNFTRTARRLNITQPAVSLNIAELEQTIGDTLFIREPGKPFSLTEKGRCLLGYAERILFLYESLNRELVPSENGFRPEKMELRVAGVKLAVGFLLPEAVKSFSVTYPHVNVSVVERTDDEIFSLLAEGLIDLGITSRPAEGVDLVSRPFADLSMNNANHPVIALWATKRKDGREKSAAIRNFILTGITR